MRHYDRIIPILICLIGSPITAEPMSPFHQHWIWSTAHRIPSELTSEESGYFSIIEGKNGRLYIGTAKYGDNAYLVEFDPKSNDMKTVVDAEKAIGVDRKGFAAQAKFHTRNNVGASGRIYLGTKQGYPKDGEQRTDYLGGHPMVYDPATGKTRVYDIPVKQHGIISVTPDEFRGIAYISTCSDERPIESTHFLILDLKTGTYRKLIDCRHLYAFIVVDHQGRAYHPVLGGQLARYDPDRDKLSQLKQTIDGKPPTEDSLLAHPQGHPINWDIAPDRKTLYAVAMSGNQLFSYDLTDDTDTLSGRSLGPLVVGATKTDCRAMCVGPDGTVWAGVAATLPGLGQSLRLVRWRPGDPSPLDLGPIAIRNPDYATFTDADGKTKPWHHGVHTVADRLVPRYTIMGICASRDGRVFLTTLYPFTLHEIRLPSVACITTEYRHNSHADVIATRLIETDSLDGKGYGSPLQLASIFADQVPENDTSRQFSRKHQIPVHNSIADALTLGRETLSVDGVLMIAEHGKYPESDTGQFVFPKRRFFSEVVDQFQQSGRVVPVFCDKHLADNWTDAKWIYDKAREMNIPMMAGSSVPGTRRFPPVDVKRDAKLKEIVAISYHRLDAYGFHALEVVQALAERREGGETGIKAVRTLTGDAVWKAGDKGVYDSDLLQQALSRLKVKPIPEGKTIQELAQKPVLFTIEYQDGLNAHVLTLDGAVLEWAAAWRYADGTSESTLFWTQEARPFMHFTWMLMGIEQLMQTGKPAWPVERTLLTSGALDALLISKRDGGKRLKTPWLQIRYQSEWNWHQPPEPPADRPIAER